MRACELAVVYVCVFVCVCVCVRACVRARACKSFVFTVMGSLLCNGLCAPIYRVCKRVHDYYDFYRPTKNRMNTGEIIHCCGGSIFSEVGLPGFPQATNKESKSAR